MSSSDKQSPDVLERVRADEILDVDAAIAKGAAVLVRLCDLRLEGDDAFEATGGSRWSRSSSRTVHKRWFAAIRRNYGTARNPERKARADGVSRR